MACDLDKKLLEKTVALIVAYKKPEKIILFGSRATGAGTKISDIDIAIVAKDWTDKDFNLVKHQLNEKISTALLFDVVDLLGVVKVSLKEKIVKEGKIIYDSGKNT